MAVTIHIPALLRHLSGGAWEVEVAGSTLDEALVELDALHPGFARRIVVDGEVRSVLHMFLNGREIRSALGLRSEVFAGDEIHLIPPIEGTCQDV